MGESDEQGLPRAVEDQGENRPEQEYLNSGHFQASASHDTTTFESLCEKTEPKKMFIFLTQLCDDTNLPLPPTWMCQQSCMCALWMLGRALLSNDLRLKTAVQAKLMGKNMILGWSPQKKI